MGKIKGWKKLTRTSWKHQSGALMILEDDGHDAVLYVNKKPFNTYTSFNRTDTRTTAVGRMKLFNQYWEDGRLNEMRNV